MQRFATAPWPVSLKLTSWFGSLLIAGVAYGAWSGIPPTGFAHLFGYVIACVILAIPLGAALFVVTGYEVDGSRLYVRRLFWATEIGLEGLSRIRRDPGAIRRCLRVFGNGGLYSFTGIYQNRELGRFRMFATDPKRPVILSLPNRVVVVTPAEPEAFIRHLLMYLPGVEVDADKADA